jgi:transposase InsO family protein
VRYQFVKLFQGQFSLSALCRVMQVARSGYYAWCKRPMSAREQTNQQLTEQIKTVFAESGQTYGSPRIHAELKAQQLACSQKRVERLMRLANLNAVLPKRFVGTTDSNHEMPVADNLLEGKFSSDMPDRVWTADISYVWTQEGWLYLAVVLDLFCRRIVGWAMGTSLERGLVLSALSMAIRNPRPETGLVCHSDRGSQYASDDYHKAHKDAGLVASMSRRGTCFDNAPTESFFSSLKRACVYRHRFATREQARTVVFTWIEVWYNRKRRRSALSYQSPDAFERDYHQQQIQALAA